jgi:hypothetical protein
VDANDLESITAAIVKTLSVLVSDSIGRLEGESTDKDFIGTLRVGPSGIDEVTSKFRDIGRRGGVRVELRGGVLLPGVNAVSHLEEVLLLVLSLSINRLPCARDNGSVSGGLVKSETGSQLVSSLR